MPQPRASVIIPCFRATGTLKLQLDALLRQVGAPPFEILLVDNEPSAPLRRFPVPDPVGPVTAIRVLFAGEQQGSSYARNVGISHAATDVLLFCDADDAVSPTWVRNGATATEACEVWSGESVLLRESAFAEGLDAVWERLGGAIDAAPPRDSQSGPLPVLMGGNFGARRGLLRELGGFDQAMAHYGDDNDLAVRIVASGRRIPVAESVRIAYRGKFSRRQRMRRAFGDSLARRAILTRHGLPDPEGMHPWPRELAGCAASTLLLPVRRGRGGPDAVAVRWSHALGDAWASLRFRTLGRLPGSRLGEGLDHARATVPR